MRCQFLPTTHSHDTKERPVFALKTSLIGVPDRHPALFEHAIWDHGSKLHRWAPMIEELVDDRVIWAYDFSAEFRLSVHAHFSGGKAWKKNLRKLDQRL